MGGDGSTRFKLMDFLASTIDTCPRAQVTSSFSHCLTLA